MLAAVFFAAGSTLSVPISLMRPTAEYIPINKAGFCRVRSTESMYGFAASLVKREYRSSWPASSAPDYAHRHVLSATSSTMATTVKIRTEGKEPMRASGRSTFSQPRYIAHAVAAGAVSKRNPAKTR
jgi:hypothetical protein